MAGFSLKIEGMDDFVARMEKAAEDVKTEAVEAIDEACKGIETDAKGAAPVNYGFLKGKISQIPATDGGLTGGVEAAADYSGYVEFGTGTHVDVPDDPEGVPELALSMKGNKEIPGMVSRPYFFPAVRKWRTILIEKINDILSKL